MLSIKKILRKMVEILMNYGFRPRIFHMLYKIVIQHLRLHFLTVVFFNTTIFSTNIFRKKLC